MINWKVRFKNKTFLLTFATVTVAFVYQILGMFNVVPPISQEQAIQFIGVVMTFLAGIGVITDPTTAGLSDSPQAMTYTQPRKETENHAPEYTGR